jgi:hypothetical protein
MSPPEKPTIPQLPFELKQLIHDMLRDSVSNDGISIRHPDLLTLALVDRTFYEICSQSTWQVSIVSFFFICVHSGQLCLNTLFAHDHLPASLLNVTWDVLNSNSISIMKAYPDSRFSIMKSCLVTRKG